MDPLPAWGASAAIALPRPASWIKGWDREMGRERGGEEKKDEKRVGRKGRKEEKKDPMTLSSPVQGSQKLHPAQTTG